MRRAVVYGVRSAIAERRVGEQKRLEQTKRRGGRISILGLWQPDKSFEYALAYGSFKSDGYIKMMDWVADEAFETLTKTGRLSVIVQDNGSLHTSRLTQQQWQRWQEKGLFVFFLPQYCSQMNRIEIECQRGKLPPLNSRKNGINSRLMKLPGACLKMNMI